MDNMRSKVTAEAITSLDSAYVRIYGYYLLASADKARIVADCKHHLEGAEGFDCGYHSALRIAVSGTPEGDAVLAEVSAYVRSRPALTMVQAYRGMAEAPKPIMSLSLRSKVSGKPVKRRVDLRDEYVKKLRAMNAQNAKPADQLESPVEIAYHPRPIMVQRQSSVRKYDLRGVYIRALREDRAAEMKEHGFSA